MRDPVEPEPQVAAQAEEAPPVAQSGPFPSPSETPTQTGPRGIRFDFNQGARIVTPHRDKGKWRVCLRDLDTGNILFQSENNGAAIRSSKQFYVRFGVEIWDRTSTGDEKLVLNHVFDAKDKEVMVQFPVGTLGDILAWFPYADRFAAQHGCRVTCAMSGLIIPLLRGSYPHIRFVTHEEVNERQLNREFYATYSLGLFFTDKDCIMQPTDFRQVGLHRTAGYILGVDPKEHPPKITLEDDSRPIAEPYVCIAVQGSTQSKYWSNPTGWRVLVQFLKDAGFRVICIDRQPTHGHGLVWNHIPYGAEDQTGDKPLAERARWLKHCEFMVGLSSGLSWLGWAMGAEVVLISGFTHPINEFETPYRVINWHACNSCWNDPRHQFDHKDFLWCPRHAGTERQFECTRLITADQVINAIKRIPAFQEAAKN